ncbi:MAG: preprotein translocase subunit YajC [Streptosporangiales bacterium]|nr:preprotein translocase subunit YajC [Streptosporangiales bacterium]
MGQLEPILFIVAIIAVFYLLLIRPQQKRKKEMSNMQQALKPGAEVVTTAGMFARVVAMEGDDALLLEVAPGVTCKYMRQSVMRVVPEEQPATPVEAADEPESLDESSDGTKDADDKPESLEAADTGADESSDTDKNTDGTGDADTSGEPGAKNGDRRSSS